MKQYITQWSRGSSTNVMNNIRQMTEYPEFDSRKQQILIYSSQRLDTLGIHQASSQGMWWDLTQYIMQHTHSVITLCDIYQLLRVSALRCHNQGVITKEV